MQLDCVIIVIFEIMVFDFLIFEMVLIVVWVAFVLVEPYLVDSEVEDILAQCENTVFQNFALVGVERRIVVHFDQLQLQILV